MQTLRDERLAAGLPLAGFAVNIALTETHDKAAVREVEDMGVTGLMIMSPWLPNPFFSAPWFDPKANPSLLETKRAAMLRFADQVIHRN